MDYRNSAGTAQAVSYPTSTAAPKEIGMLQRIDGVQNGIGEIEAQLRAFLNKLAGGPPVSDNLQRPRACGLLGTVEEAETGIRECLGILRNLNDSF